MNKPLEPDFSEVTDQSSDRPHARRRWIVLVLSLLALAAVIMFLLASEDTADVTRTASPPVVQQVSVETLAVGPQTAEVSAFAEIRPRWSAELRASVPGRVEQVFDTALAGERVDAGTELITIEDSRYVAELAAAELALKQAELALWKAENATTLARREYERNNAKPPNDLALRLPELEIARSSVKSARARLAAAQQQLDDTRISAPFSGFIAVRFISLGQSVNSGDALVRLVDDTVFEVTVELGRSGTGPCLHQPLQRIGRSHRRPGAVHIDRRWRRSARRADFLMKQDTSIQGVPGCHRHQPGRRTSFAGRLSSVSILPGKDHPRSA